MSVVIAPQFTQRAYPWTGWKAVQASKKGNYQFDESGDFYLIWFYDGPEVHLCTIWRSEVPHGVVSGGYTQDQNDADKAEFEGLFKPTGNGIVEPRTSDGRAIQALSKPDSNRRNFFSHNWCDKTTWYQKSTFVANETPTTSDNTVYQLANLFVIDTYHGKLTQEDFLLDADNRSYRVAVTVDSVSKTEQDPHYGSGGDYTVDYAAGRVSFLVAQSPGAAVRVSYHYAGDSTFTFGPDAGQNIDFTQTEVQFSTDVGIMDSMRYNAFGYIDIFAPQLLIANGGPYPSGTKIPLGNDFIYKTIGDFMNDCFKAYPSYAPIGGGSWRGMPVATTVFDWDYETALKLYSAYGMEVRVWMEHHTAFTGTFATATFYCTDGR